MVSLVNHFSILRSKCFLYNYCLVRSLVGRGELQSSCLIRKRLQMTSRAQVLRSLSQLGKDPQDPQDCGFPRIAVYLNAFPEKSYQLLAEVNNEEYVNINFPKHLAKLYMYGCFLKWWWYPQIIHFNRVFHYFHHPFWGPFGGPAFERHRHPGRTERHADLSLFQLAHLTQITLPQGIFQVLWWLVLLLLLLLLLVVVVVVVVVERCACGA